MPNSNAGSRWSTIGRKVDLRVPTNLAIAIISLLVLISGLWTGLARGAAFVATTLLGLSWAFGVFLAWALARELDPDRWYSAFFAAALAMIAAFLYSPPALLITFWALIGLRFINRSTGLAPGWLDIIAFSTLSLWLGWSIHWTIPLLSLLPLLVTGQKLRPDKIQFALAAGMGLLGCTLGILQAWPLVHLDAAEIGFDLRIIAAIALANALVIRSYREVRSRADRTDEPLEPMRVQWGLSWTLVVGIVLALGAGISVKVLHPLWAALAGSILGWGLQQLLPLLKRKET